MLASFPVACRTPEGYYADADEEAYEIILRRREELGEQGTFTIEPPPESLRKRILAAAEEGTPLAIEPLGLVDCLEIAAENSREYRRRRELLYLAALDLTLERYRFDTQFSGVLGATFNGTGNGDTSATASADLGLSKLFGSGALILGNVGIDFFRALSTGDAWDAVSLSSITITQPLMRGFGKSIVEEPLTQAERNVLYEARSYERFRRTFAFDVSSRVFRIAQQVDTLRNEEINYESLIQIRERNEAFAEAGQLLDLEVDQARQDELRARNRVVNAQRDLEALLDDFKLFLGLPVETPLSIRQEDLDGLFGLDVPEVEISEEEIATIALRERLDHLTQVDRVEDSERQVQVTEDALRAGLDFSATVTANEADRPFRFDGEDVAWSGGLFLDLPIERLPERNAYRAAWIGLEASRRALDESADFVYADVRDALRQLAATRESRSIQENAVSLAERRVEGARLNLEAGRAETRDLLESQEALVQAQNAATQARVDFALAGLALYRDMELLRLDGDGLRVETAPLTAEGNGE